MPKPRRPTAAFACVAALLALVLAAPAAAGQAAGSGPSAASAPGRAKHADDRIIVSFKAHASSAERKRALAGVSGHEGRSYASGARLVHVPRGSVDAALTRLGRDRAVRAAEPDVVVQLQRQPNDPSVGDLWGLINNGQTVNGTAGTADADIDADLAWEQTTGSRSIVVAVVDTGVDQDHPDLASNLWTNPGGVGGCAAGTHGYDALGGDCDPEDDQDHGSHVSGTIGAAGNNGLGVVGVNWTTSIMAIKSFSAAGEATTSSILGGLDFAIRARDAGVPIRVMNASWGGFEYSQATSDMIGLLGARDVLFVTAAGNYGFPNDYFGFYPCGYDVATIICVAASDQADDLAWFSNYGTSSVDLAAPGVNVLSTVRGGGYRLADGTSMATPHVVGAAALVLSRRNMSALDLRELLLATVDPKPGLEGAVATGGRLNVGNAVASVSPLPGPPPLSATAATGVVHLTWTAPPPGDAPIQTYRIYRGASAADPTPLVDLPATTLAYDDTDVVNETTYVYQISAISSLGEGSRSSPVTVVPPAPPTIPATPSLTALAGDGAVHLCWTPPFDGRSPITGYDVSRAVADGPQGDLVSVSSNTTRYADTTVQTDQTYAYALRARNAVGPSEWSAPAGAIPGAGTAPAVSSFAPAIVAPGDSVAISGTNFATGACPNDVKFDLQTGIVSSSSATEIVALTPAAGGSGPLSVTTPAGTSTTTTDLFIVPPPNTPGAVGWTGRLNAGTAQTVSLPTAGKVALALFAGSSGDRVSLNVTNVTINASQVSILRPDGGAFVPSRRVISWGSFFDTMTLPTSGTYTVVVDPEGTYTGSLRLSLYRVPPDGTATISANGPAATVTTSVPGQNASVTFEGTTGQRVSLSVTSVTMSGSDLSILRPDGGTLAPSRYVNTSGTFFDTMTLPVAGTYRVTINPREAATGNMTLRLYEVPADSTASLTINGPATSLAMSVPGQNGSVTFDGIAGQRVSVHVTSVTIGQSDLAILKPDGGTLAPARYVTTSGTFFDTMTLPTSGTYRISVNPRSAFTGSLSLRAYAVPADASGSLDPAGPATTVSVTVPGQNAAATFVGTAGARVSLNVTPVSIGASDIAILKPDGTVMAPSRYVGTGGTFFDTMTLPLAGTYRVTINPRDAQVGNATLRLYDVPADATVTLAVGGGPGTITTTVPGQNASATFAGNAAQAVTLVLSAVTIGQSDVSILKPDGSTLVAPVFVTTSGRTITTTLPVAGTYRIVVNPRATFTGNMTLQL